ncbi:AAA family ATPase [Halorussus halobius]|uniref:AAA family ATPase n=1 Tax=Halorussus halobius TaxID=1710537 RepID=UPI001092650A|nr:MoxR family ATPase [Halorussus halobius]
MTDRNPSIDDVTNRIQAIRSAVGRRIVGQQEVVDHVLACMLCDGNALLESTPGLGKTLLVRTLAEVTGLSFSRIQNTPDLMPSDVVGTEMVRETEAGRTFSFEKGPVFANLVLSDEINRATPKTQSALLEAMEEGQVTAGDETYDLPEPFFVLATQNPIDQEGTYPLPEAQTDRFLLKVVVDYPTADAEREIVDRYTGDVDASISVDRQVSPREFRTMQQFTHQVPIADDLRDLAVGIVRDTRTAEDLEYGASPRASMSLVRVAKARALMEGRTHVSADDVTAMAKPVLRHRVVVDFRAEREGLTAADVVESIVEDR